MKMKRRNIFILLVILLFSVLFYISIIAPIIPLSYDEAWNYTNISSKGPLYAITNFPFANNHVFFTVLQAITVPQKLLPYFPEATRVLNVCVSIAIFTLIYFSFLHVLHKKSPLWLVLITASCFFVSPLVTPFYIVARGYLLGMFLLFSGIYFLYKKKYYVALLFFILSGWTVVTYIYALPVVYLAATCIQTKDWKKICFSEILMFVGLYVVYKPILLTVLTQGTLWNTASLAAFFYSQWRSLSYISYLPYGNIGNGLFTGAYILSIIILFRKRYFVLLNSAVASYCIVITIISLLHVAHPPYERAGLLIPVIASITILGSAAVVQRVWMKYLLRAILGINVLTGVYFFATGLPHTEYLAPVPYPISLSERQLLKEKKLPYLTLSRPEHEPFLLYFSQIYAVPLHTIDRPMPVPIVNPDKQPIILSLATKQEPALTVLPTNPLYIFKRIWQYTASALIDFFTITKTPHIRYLLSLSDITYAEADTLWQQKRYDLAVKTLARGENYITLTVGETRDVLGITKNKDIVRDILSSIALHQTILVKMTATGNKTSLNQLASLISFFNRNLETVLSLAME